MAWHLPDKHRRTYALYMGGLTLKEVGALVGVSPQRAQEMVQVADRCIERAARGAERDLWRETPQQWHARDALEVDEDLLGVWRWKFEAAVPRHLRPAPARRFRGSVILSRRTRRIGRGLTSRVTRTSVCD